MTLADQLRSFPVPPRHVLIAGAGEIERLRRENERLTAELEAAHFVRDKVEHAKCRAERHAYHLHMSEADMVASNLEDRCRDAEAEAARLTALVHHVYESLRQGQRVVEQDWDDMQAVDKAYLAQQREGLAPKEGR